MSKKNERKPGEFYKNAYNGIHGSMIATPWARAAFVGLVTPNNKFDPPKYGLSLLCPKEDKDYPVQSKDKKAQLKEIQSMCQEMSKQLFGAKPPKSEYPFLRDGDTQKYDGYPGNWVIVAKNTEQPEMAAGQTVEVVKAGLWVRAVVIPYLDKRGFSYKLVKLNVLHDDGVRYAAAPKADGILEALDEATDFVAEEFIPGGAESASDEAPASSMDIL